MEFVSTKKTFIILGVIIFVAVALPVSVYLFQKGYFDIRNRASDEEDQQEELDSVTKYGSGNDGACTVSSDKNLSTESCSGRSTGDAVSYNVSEIVSAGATSVTLSSEPTGIAVNDEVMLITLQGTSDDYSGVGNYETAIVSEVSGSTVTLSTSLVNDYDGTNNKVILQRVPNYTTVTVNSGAEMTAPSWDGDSGGVIFFKATGAVTINGEINADGLGYRGGTDNTGGETFGGYNSGNSGKDGDMGGGGGGNSGTEHASNPGGDGSETGGAGGAGGQGSGEGYDNERGAGGGGGGYGTGGNGGVGQNTGETGGTNVSGDGGTARRSSGRGIGGGGGGGGTYGFADLSRLYFGSGGGGGGSGGSRIVGDGGSGGGIIYISALSITVSGSISSDGSAGTNGSTGDSGGSGGGGGGAGGSISLVGDDVVLGENLVAAVGGIYGTGRYRGGTGGDGRISVTFYSSVSGTTDPTYNSVDLSNSEDNGLGACSYADINEDGSIDMTDYSLFVEDYLDYRDEDIYNERSDFNEDQAVTMSDYALFVTCYLENN